MSDYLVYLRNLMRHLETIMSEEKIAEDVRKRVINRLMLGTAEPEEPKALEEPQWPESFGDLKPGAVWMPMHDDSNSGPGWPLPEPDEDEDEQNHPAVNTNMI